MSEVRCRRCNKVLTNSKSKARGYGPDCWAIIQDRKPEEAEG